MGRCVPAVLVAWAIASATALAGAEDAAPPAPRAPDLATRTYRVEQSVTLSDVAPGARQVRWWIAIPDADREQELLDLAVTSAPGRWRIEREAEHGNRFLYVEVDRPAATTLATTVAFTVRRRAAWIELDPAKAAPLSDALRSALAAELRDDAPHMAVTDEIRRTADSICRDERNLAVQARLLLDHVADFADHYSKDASKPKCGIGDARDCMANQGGCCTDLHSLFVALARARGIPARLQMGYRLLEKNAGKVVDPGYRCWPEYFVPGFGWIAADVVEADAVDGLGRDRWFSGLTERRVHLNEGREFLLSPPQAAPGRVNTMIIGYAEIDGVPARVLPEGEKAPQLARTIRFEELAAGTRATLDPAPARQ